MCLVEGGIKRHGEPESAVQMATPSLVSKMSMSIAPESQRLAGVGSHPRAVESDMQFRMPPALPVVSPLAMSGSISTQAQKDDIAKVRGSLSYAEILRHRSADDAWIVVDGNVYDVTEFLETHPGGPELIMKQLQADCAEDAGPLMRGAVGEDAHGHSKAAFRMLEQFYIGMVETSAPGYSRVETTKAKKYQYDVDLTKPIVAQVGYLGADYDEWVHDPIVCKESPRFFESDICEFFTRTSWWVIPLVWCPVALCLLYLAVVKEGMALARMPGMMIAGFISWTLVEYILHRCLFHMKTSSFWGNTMHYVLHGFHHKHPMDGSRLVFPPAFAMVIVLAIWSFMGTWVPPPIKFSLFGSSLLGYVGYDLTHYYLHFGAPLNEHSRKMKRYHLNHHFKDQRNGYGITTNVWDRALRTLPSEKVSIE